jgi:hypothetical protein
MRPLPERRARRAGSPQDLADRCQIIFVSSPTFGRLPGVAFGAESLGPRLLCKPARSKITTAWASAATWLLISLR